ncbi:MAG TPA: hypothetical protein VN039_13710 [Nitrospira sp.]|nr:hypothetical protein [Nitrospira sp.]
MASSPVRIRDLEISQDLDLQRTTWTLQRIGWGGMALIILAALSGVFGSGPLARTEVTDDPHTVRLLYDRFGRYEDSLVLQLVLAPETIKTNRVTVEVDRAYWTSHAVEHITPEPLVSSIGIDGFLYTFEADARSAPAVIVFHLRPKYVGALDGRIRVNDSGPLRFHQFMFP